MTLFDWIAAFAGGWLILACIGGTSWAVVVTAYKRRTRRIVGAYPACVPVHRVPTQADLDATWRIAWPSAVGDVDDVNRRFNSLISSTWHWPEDAL